MVTGQGLQRDNFDWNLNFAFSLPAEYRPQLRPRSRKGRSGCTFPSSLPQREYRTKRLTIPLLHTYYAKNA